MIVKTAFHDALTILCTHTISINHNFKVIDPLVHNFLHIHVNSEVNIMEQETLLRHFKIQT